MKITDESEGGSGSTSKTLARIYRHKGKLVQVVVCRDFYESQSYAKVNVMNDAGSWVTIITDPASNWHEERIELSRVAHALAQRAEAVLGPEEASWREEFRKLDAEMMAADCAREARAAKCGHPLHDAAGVNCRDDDVAYVTAIREGIAAREKEGKKAPAGRDAVPGWLRDIADDVRGYAAYQLRVVMDGFGEPLEEEPQRLSQLRRLLGQG